MMRRSTDRVFDPGLQPERTALAWERTAVAAMVAGTLFARYTGPVHPAIALVGVATVVGGALLLIWASTHYDEVHEPLQRSVSPVHPAAARIVGAWAVVFTATAFVVTTAVVVWP